MYPLLLHFTVVGLAASATVLSLLQDAAGGSVDAIAATRAPFNTTHGFVNASFRSEDVMVQPVPEGDSLLNLAWKSITVANHGGFMICIYVGLLFIPLMPVIRVIYGISRCCGKCKDDDRDSRSAKTKRNAIYALVFTAATYALFGAARVFWGYGLHASFFQPSSPREGLSGGVQANLSASISATNVTVEVKAANITFVEADNQDDSVANVGIEQRLFADDSVNGSVPLYQEAEDVIDVDSQFQNLITNVSSISADLRSSTSQVDLTRSAPAGTGHVQDFFYFELSMYIIIGCIVLICLCLGFAWWKKGTGSKLFRAVFWLYVILSWLVTLVIIILFLLRLLQLNLTYEDIAAGLTTVLKKMPEVNSSLDQLQIMNDSSCLTIYQQFLSNTDVVCAEMLMPLSVPWIDISWCIVAFVPLIAFSSVVVRLYIYRSAAPSPTEANSQLEHSSNVALGSADIPLKSLPELPMNQPASVPVEPMCGSPPPVRLLGDPTIGEDS